MKKKREKANWVWWLSYIGFAIIVFAAVVTHWDFLKSNNLAIRNVGLPIVGLLSLPIVIWRAISAGRASRASANQTENQTEEIRLSREAQLSERFVKAVELLEGYNDPGKDMVRVGAVYSLKQIMFENPEKYTMVVVDILAAMFATPGFYKPLPNLWKTKVKGVLLWKKTVEVFNKKDLVEWENQAPPMPQSFKAALHVLGNVNYEILEDKEHFLNISSGWFVKGIIAYFKVKNMACTDSKFVNSNFTDSKFINCVFFSCEFYSLEFNDCQFVNCQFIGCTIYDTDFTITKLENCEFSNCYMRYTWFSSCAMKLTFHELKLEDATFKESKKGSEILFEEEITEQGNTYDPNVIIKRHRASDDNKNSTDLKPTE